jgi:hypothetical protein
MIRPRSLIVDSAAGLLVAWPTVAAESDAGSNDIVTGLSNIGPAVFIIAVALALLLTVVLRVSAARFFAHVSAAAHRRQVRAALNQISPYVFEDAILPGAYGGLTHIDFAILTSRGLLCIRTKHYRGLVVGASDEPQWTIVTGLQSRKFLNPLIQNEGRSRALSKLVPELPIDNLVVFTGSVQFGAPIAANVIHSRELTRYIRAYAGEAPQDWDPQSIWARIQEAILTDDASRKDFDAQLSFS